MSRRLSKYHHSDHSGQPVDGRLSHAAAVGRWAAGYTLAHAGRQLRLGLTYSSNLHERGTIERLADQIVWLESGRLSAAPAAVPS